MSCQLSRSATSFLIDEHSVKWRRWTNASPVASLPQQRSSCRPVDLSRRPLPLLSMHDATASANRRRRPTQDALRIAIKTLLTSKMNVYTNLKHANNHAAAMVAEGRYKAAYEELKIALSRISKTVSQSADKGESPSEQSMFCVTPLDSNSDSSTSPLFVWSLTMPVEESTNPEDLCLELVAAACAVGLFNVGLACHLGAFLEESQCKRTVLLRRAMALYTNAFEVGDKSKIGALNLALATNMMDISFDQGDLGNLHFWRAFFSDRFQSFPTEALPSKIHLVFCHIQVYYTNGLVAARAA